MLRAQHSAQVLNDRLIEAIKRNDADAVTDLLERGADANIWSVLNLWDFGDVDTPALLIALDWHLITQGSEDRGPVSMPILTALLDAGADVEARPECCATALMTAAFWGECEVANLLLNRGANVNATDEMGRTALYESCVSGQTAMASLLLSNGADINIRDTLGQTPLILAVINQHVDTVRMLLEHGADVQIETRKGQTALSLAQRERGPIAKIKVMLESMLARQDAAIVNAMVPIVLVICLACYPAIPQPAPRFVRYTITDLGRFSASAINNKGWIAGSTYEAAGTNGHRIACVYRHGKIEPLEQPKIDPESYALALNDQGTVVGNSTYRFFAGFNTVRPYLWKEGKAIALKMQAGDNVGEASAINTQGQIVGSSGYFDKNDPHSLKSHAIVWNAGMIIDLGSLGGHVRRATAINDTGQVVGDSERADGGSHAFLYENGKMHDLGTLGGSISNAVSINARGHIAGESDLGKEDTSHAFLWSEGKMQDLGTLPNRQNSSVNSINDKDQIVGYAYTDVMKPHAFLWQNGRMLDLNRLIPANSGWVLEIPSAIDNRGQILGNGKYHGVPHAFLIKPILH